MKDEYQIAEVNIVGITPQRLARMTFPNLPTILPEDIILVATGSIMENKEIPDYYQTEVRRYNGRSLIIEDLERLLGLDSRLCFRVQSYKKWM